MCLGKGSAPNPRAPKRRIVHTHICVYSSRCWQTCCRWWTVVGVDRHYGSLLSCAPACRFNGTARFDPAYVAMPAGGIYQVPTYASEVRGRIWVADYSSPRVSLARISPGLLCMSTLCDVMRLLASSLYVPSSNWCTNFCCLCLPARMRMHSFRPFAWRAGGLTLQDGRICSRTRNRPIS